MTTEQRVRLEEARMRALGMALSGGPIFKVPQPAPVDPMPHRTPTCYYNTIAGTLYENCY